MAPELFRREPFDERIDVYSFGLIIWSLLNDGEEPFQQLTSQVANLPVDQQIAQVTLSSPCHIHCVLPPKLVEFLVQWTDFP